MNLMKALSWTQVRNALENITKVHAYYLGGSLCLDLAQGYSIVLNRSGRGFAFSLHDDKCKELKFLMPKDVQITVEELYWQHKRQYKLPLRQKETS